MKLDDVSGFRVPLNSSSEIIKFAIWFKSWRLDIISLAALNPITEYPDVELEKLKYNCLKSGVLKPFPKDNLIEILSFNLVLNAALGLNTDWYWLCLSNLAPKI